MKPVLFLISVFVQMTLLSQLNTYTTKSKKDHIYLILNTDSIQLFTFSVKRYGIQLKTAETVQIKQGNIDSGLSKFKSYSLAQKNNRPYLQTNGKNTYFKLAKNERWKYYQKEAFESGLRDDFLNLKDSLSCSIQTDEIEPLNWEYEKRDDSTSYTSFQHMIGHSYDSLSQLIISLSSVQVNPYYKQVSTNFTSLDSLQAFQLLTNITEIRGYTSSFIQHLALKNPEYLIRYMDHTPTNAQVIAKIVRDASDYKAIHLSFKNCPRESLGKEKLVHQYQLRKRKNTAKKIISVSNVFGQLALTTLVLLWIF